MLVITFDGMGRLQRDGRRWSGRLRELKRTQGKIWHVPIYLERYVPAERCYAYGRCESTRGR